MKFVMWEDVLENQLIIKNNQNLQKTQKTQKTKKTQTFDEIWASGWASSGLDGGFQLLLRPLVFFSRKGLRPRVLFVRSGR